MLLLESATLLVRAYLVCRVYRVGTVCVGHDAIYGPFLFTLLYGNSVVSSAVCYVCSIVVNSEAQSSDHRAARLARERWRTPLCLSQPSKTSKNFVVGAAEHCEE